MTQFEAIAPKNGRRYGWSERVRARAPRQHRAGQPNHVMVSKWNSCVEQSGGCQGPKGAELVMSVATRVSPVTPARLHRRIRWMDRRAYGHSAALNQPGSREYNDLMIPSKSGCPLHHCILLHFPPALPSPEHFCDQWDLLLSGIFSFLFFHSLLVALARRLGHLVPPRLPPTTTYETSSSTSPPSNFLFFPLSFAKQSPVLPIASHQHSSSL